MDFFLPPKTLTNFVVGQMNKKMKMPKQDDKKAEKQCNTRCFFHPLFLVSGSIYLKYLPISYNSICQKALALHSHNINRLVSKLILMNTRIMRSLKHFIRSCLDKNVFKELDFDFVNLWLLCIIYNFSRCAYM